MKHPLKYQWSGVKEYVDERFKRINRGGLIWSEAKGNHISVSLCTRNRYYTTLPLAMASLAMQTRKPDHIFIYDDTVDDKTEKTQWRDLRYLPEIKYILATYDQLGIGWEIIYGQKKGQHYGDQTMNIKARDLVWRFDDDEIADPNCLEEMEKAMTDDVGAVGCRIVIPGNPIYGTATGKLENIRIEPNIQWIGGEGFVEHLHSSFLYRSHVANFDLRLSPRSFRGETMFSHEIFKKGYKLKVINNVTIYHYHEQKGGNRTPEENKTSNEMYAHDEDIFNKWIQVKEKRIFYMDNGRGDHIVFRKVLDDLNIKDIPIALCYPELFEGYETMSLSAAQQLGHNPDDHHLYKWMDENNWNGDLYTAFKTFYKL